MPHNHLPQSLADVGITGQPHQWFASYLSGRYKRVVLDSCSSGHQPVSSGAPQGLIFGPLPYIIFMYSISKLDLSQGTKLVLYADDILLYKPITSNNDCGVLQKDVKSILGWIESHGLAPKITLNPNSSRSPGLGKLYHQRKSRRSLNLTLTLCEIPLCYPS